MFNLILICMFLFKGVFGNSISSFEIGNEISLRFELIDLASVSISKLEIGVSDI